MPLPHRLTWQFLSMAFLLIGSLAGCSSSSSETSSSPWGLTEESCVYEASTPPLRRVTNYADPSLCNRAIPPTKKVRKRLRDLFKEEQ